MNHFPFHIGDYIKSTVHLNNEEDLTYLRLIFHYYDTEKPIPKNTEAVAKRLRLKHRIVLGILAEFFSDSEDGWRSKRCDEELAKYHALLQNASNAGKASAQRRANARSTPVQRPLRSRSTNQEPRTSNQEPEPRTVNQEPGKPAAVAASDPVKREIWETGKALLGKDSASLLGKLCKEYGQILVLQAVKDCVSLTPAEPKAWLVARCQERRAQSGNKSAAIELRNHEAVEQALREAHHG